MSTGANNFSLELKPSSLHLHFIVWVHTAASCLVFLLSAEMVWKIILALAVSGSLLYELYKWRALSRFQRLSVQDPNIYLYLRQQELPLEVTLDVCQLVLPICSILFLRTGAGDKVCIPLFRDSATADNIRKLRVFLIASPPLKSTSKILAGLQLATSAGDKIKRYFFSASDLN